MSYSIGITYRETEKLGPYVDALRACGVRPVPLSPGDGASLYGLDGLLLSGGTDVNPSLYGQERVAETDEPDDERDEMDLRLLRDALEVNLPFLGICRGMQIFNVLCGGTLVQHLPNAEAHHHRFSTPEHRVLHSVETVDGTRLDAICGSRRFIVNSRHHQGVNSIGAGLTVSAVSSDGIVEAIERLDKRFALAVQWHPEDRFASVIQDRAILDSFVSAVVECGRGVGSS
jgi:putative glutamine amidotransferase